MKLVPLTKGLFAKVDDADYEDVARFKWCVWGTYAARSLPGHLPGQPQYRSMHAQLMNPPEGFEVDHVNRDRLDNRRCNLRVCSAQQNMANRQCGNNAAGLNGVTPDRGKWKAHFETGGKHYNLGRYDSAEEAARVRDAMAFKINGEFAALNFPNETPNPALLDRPTRAEALKAPRVCKHCGKTCGAAGIGMHESRCAKIRGIT